MESTPYIGEILSLTAALSWAIGVILFKRTGEKMPPLSLNLFKNILAIALLIPTMPLLGESLVPDVPASYWWILLASGVIGITIADTMFFFSLEKLGAGLTAVVDTSYTPIILAMSFVFLGERMGPIELIGAGLIMTALIVGSATKPPPGKTRKDILLGIVVGVSGIALMGVGIVMIKGILSEVPLVWATFVRVVGGFLGLLPVIALHPRRGKILSALAPSSNWKFAIGGSFFGTYLAMTAWIGGMKFIDVSRAALLNQLSTIFIFVFAIVFLKEAVTLRRIAAILLAILGALCVVYPAWIIYLFPGLGVATG